MIYQHPLAFVLGLEGVALLRAFAGDYDRSFGEARVAAIRRLLDEPSLGVDGVAADWVTPVEGYRVWSATYDEPGNGIFAYEEPYVHAILDGIEPRVTLDAACGTGRHTAELAARGHRVIAVDSSTEMLARARDRVPSADLRSGDLHRLPVTDGEVDLVVCALALTHVPRLGPVFAEFARVLRPGGHLIVSDVHHLRVVMGSMPRMRDASGRPGFMPAHRHLASDYIGAALPVGLRLLGCEEPASRGASAPPPPSTPSPPEVPASAAPSSAAVGPWDTWPWSLMDIDPEAAAAAFRGVPVTVIWHFQLADP